MRIEARGFTIILVLAALAGGMQFALTGELFQAATESGRNLGNKMSDQERQLVESSRKAILETGFSAPYFQKHFQLTRVIDKPGDRRVIWRFSFGEHEATVNDAVGDYVTGTGVRVNVHSVKNILGSAHDIQKTISRKEAEQLMRKCIGEYTSAAVELGMFSVPRRLGLFMTAMSVGKKREMSKEEREKKQAEEASKALPARKGNEADEIEKEGEESGRLFYGVVDLETGKCTKGEAIASPQRK